MHLKHWYCMLIHSIHGYYCIYRPWQPLTYLYFPYHCISLIYFSFTKISMFLYARIYWLAEFGDVSSLQFNYLRVETLTPTWEDLVGHLSDNLVGHLSDNFKSEVRQNSVSDLRVWSLIHFEGSVALANDCNYHTIMTTTSPSSLCIRQNNSKCMKEVYLDSVGVVIVLSLYHTSLVIEYPYFPAKESIKLLQCYLI